MNFDTAVKIILGYLKQHQRATNNVLIDLIKGDRDLFQGIREHLILNDLAEDKKGVGLVYLHSEEDAASQDETDQVFQETPGSLKIFISYGRKDAEILAKKLEKDLVAEGHVVWLDKRKMLSGASWEEQIEEAILSHEVFISLLSPHAVRRPDGVCLDEISMARFHNRKIVPAMVIHCRPPLSIYRLDWIDFQDWEEDNLYKRSFERMNLALAARGSYEGSYARIFSNLKPLDFGVEIARMTKEFTGRKWLLAEVDDWLMNSSGKVFYITGDPGIGKSSIMAHLASRHPQVMAYHFCIASLADSLNPDQFVKSVAAQLATQVEAYHDAISQLNFEQITRLDAGTLFRRIIADPLKTIELKENVVLLVDALDEAWDESGSNIVKVLQERLEDLPSQVRVVVSSRKIPYIFDLLSRYKPHEIDPGRIENIHDISEYLDLKFSEPSIQSKLPENTSERQEIKRSIIRKSEGNFLYIKQFIYGLETDQIDVRDLASFPDSLVGIYLAFFDRIFSGKEDYDHYRPILEVIACLRKPFSAKELAPILQLSEFEIRRRMQTLSAFFSDKEGRYYPFHKSVTDWLTGTAGSGGKYLLHIDRGRTRVIEYLTDCYQQEDYHEYLIDFLPDHLIEGERFEELVDLLLDLNFITRKCAQGKIYDLIQDFRAAFAVLPETRESMKQEEEYTGKITNYTRELVLHPERIQNREICIESLAPWNERQIDSEIKRMESAPTTSDVLGLILQFLYAQSHLLFRFAGLDGYVMQQARNYARSGPFADLVQKFWGNNSHFKLLYAKELREDFNPFDPCVRVFEEHTERILGVSLTMDGKYAVTGSNDNSMKLWDMQSGECLKTIKPHIDYLKSLDATPDLNLVASSGGSHGPDIHLWNYRDLESRGQLRGHTKRVNQLRITPDGRTLISGSEDTTVKVWDTHTLECVADFRYHTADVISVDISLDGRIGISSAYDNTICIWDIPGKKLIRTFKGETEHGYYGYALKLSADNKFLYTSSGYDDWTIRIWDLQSGKCISTLSGHEYGINCLEVTHDGNFLLSASSDKTIRVWNLQTNTCIKVIEGHVGPVLSLRITPDLKYIISGGGGRHDSTARVWNIYKSKLPGDDQVLPKNIRKITFSINGNFILNLSRKVIQIRDMHTGLVRTELEGHRAHIKQVWINPEGTRIISASLDRTIRVWDVPSNTCLAVLKGHTDGVLDFSLSEDLGTLVSTGWDGEFIEWDLAAFSITGRFQSLNECIEHVAHMKGEENILSIGSNSEMKIWDRNSHRCLHHVDFPVPISSRISPQRSGHIFFGFADGSIHYWDIGQMQKLMTLSGHTELVSSLEWAEDGQTLVSGSLDGTIRQWDISTGNCVCVLQGHRDKVHFLRRVPWENRIISASTDHTIRVWELYTGKCLAILSTNLLVTSLSEVQESGRFAFGTMQGEFKLIDPNL